MRVATFSEISKAIRMYEKLKSAWNYMKFKDWIKVWYRIRKLQKIKSEMIEENFNEFNKVRDKLDV